MSNFDCTRTHQCQLQGRVRTLLKFSGDENLVIPTVAEKKRNRLPKKKIILFVSIIKCELVQFRKIETPNSIVQINKEYARSFHFETSSHSQPESSTAIVGDSRKVSAQAIRSSNNATIITIAPTNTPSNRQTSRIQV